MKAKEHMEVTPTSEWLLPTPFSREPKALFDAYGEDLQDHKVPGKPNVRDLTFVVYFGTRAMR